MAVLQVTAAATMAAARAMVRVGEQGVEDRRSRWGLSWSERGQKRGRGRWKAACAERAVLVTAAATMAAARAMVRWRSRGGVIEE